MLMAPATHGLLSVIAIAPAFTVAPFITGNTNGGGAFTSDTLTVNYAISGQPTPTVSFSWFSEYTGTVVGTAISQSGNGLADTFGTPSNVRCTVTATNGLGTASITTANMFVATRFG